MSANLEKAVGNIVGLLVEEVKSGDIKWRAIIGFINSFSRFPLHFVKQRNVVFYLSLKIQLRNKLELRIKFLRRSSIKDYIHCGKNSVCLGLAVTTWRLSGIITKYSWLLQPLGNPLDLVLSGAMASIEIDFNDKSSLLLIIENKKVIHTIPADTAKSISQNVRYLLASNKAQDIEQVNSLVTNVIKAKNLSILNYLLSRGYKIGILNDSNQTALHLIFCDWYKTENLEMINLSTKNISEVNFTDINGLNHLHIASAMGKLEVVTYYLDKNEDINASYVTDIEESKLNRSGFTPLHFAVINSRLEVVKLLLERGANVNATDSAGRTPLHLASGTRPELEFEGTDYLEIIKVLIKYKCNLNAKDNNGNTPLINIYYKETEEPLVSLEDGSKADQEAKKKEMFEFLMGFSPDIKVSNNNGDTIFHCIINDLNRLRRPRELSKISFDDTKHLKMLMQLLTVDETVDINVKNNQGETPLQLAVAYMSTEIVKFLLEHKADLNNLKFDCNNRYFFKYHDIVPDLEAVVHLLGVLESLETKGFEPTMEDDLAVLRFLVHDYEDCKCYSDDLLDNDNTVIKIISLLKSGSAKHIKVILKKIEDELKPQNTIITRYDHRLLYIAFYKKYIKSADFYIDKGVEEAIDHLLQVNNVNQDGPANEKLKSKVDCMKSALLNENLNVYDVATQHPHKIYRHVFGEKFDYKFYNLDNFPGYGTFISGHFAKSLIRNYVEKVADTFLESLFPYFPTSFFETLISYLSNDDVLQVALAVVAKDPQ